MASIMAVGEQTILDAPVTPAPLFAYRALRAVIWGEEDTPEAASKYTEPVAKRGSVSSPSGPRERRDKSQLQLTPSQKRKHAAIAQPSPSKSILRTPGVNTPRRALLKDLNVTFKDLRKSVSPEMARKDQLMPATSRVDVNEEKENQPTRQNTTAASSKSEADPMKDFFSITRVANIFTQPQPVSKGVVPRASSYPLAQTVSAPMPTSTSVTPFDADTYIRNTEKEMKRLIKYGQKMRDHARRMDEENNKLRLMLEATGEENERLRLQLEGCEGTKLQKLQSKNNHSGCVTQAKATRSDLQHQQRRQEIQSIRTAKHEHRKLTAPEDDVKLPFDHNDPIASEPHKSQLNLTHKPKPKPQTRTNAHTRQPLTDSNTNSNPTTKDSSDLASPSPSPSPSPVKRQRHSNLPSTSQSIQQSQVQSLPTQLSAKTSSIDTKAMPVIGLGLAPDRLAAARARVRKRAELRKASSDDVGTENLGGASGRAGSGHRDEVGSRVETSLVDWAGL